MEKVKVFIKNNFKLISIIFFVVVVTLLVILQITKRSKETVSDYSKITYDKSKVNPDTNNFRVVEFTPGESVVEAWDMNFSLLLTFSQPINEESIKVEINPNVSFKLVKDTKNAIYLWIIPQESWTNNTEYNVVVKEGTSINGENLETAYNHTFVVKQIIPVIY